MLEVIKLFKQIQKTSSLNDKKKIITNNKDNELFKECLKFLLDGNVTTGIAEKKFDSITVQTSDWVHNDIDSEFLGLLNYIKQHNTGREEDVIHVQSWCCMMSNEVKDFVRGLITKSIKLGADAKLVNKCIHGLIPTFDVMLGTPIDKVKLKGNEWISISRKLNGCFDGNTYITMSDNTKKKIKDIVIGDEVLSFNENTKKISKQKVINVFDNGLKDRSEWMQIETAVERGNLRDFIQVTKNHKIFTPDGWKEAGTLYKGDTIYIKDYDWTKCYGEYKLIERKIEKIILSEELKFNHSSERKSNRAYDIEVENNHTYFANGYAVHNCRCAFVGNKCMTRQGKEYIGLDHIINDITKTGYENYFIDGELLYKNSEGLSDSESFQKGTGIAMSKDENKLDLKLVVFDLFPLEEFWNGKSHNTYKNRRKALNLFDLQLQDVCCKNIEVVNQLYAGTDHSEIWKWLDYAEENDWEGVIINLDEPYECKRTKNLIKVKKFLSCDIKCIGIEGGSGRNRGTLGALVCDYKGNKVNVGSGFSDEDRKRIWQNPEGVIGKIITVKYKEETKNKDGGISIQFPVFETVRFDKSEPSYN